MGNYTPTEDEKRVIAWLRKRAEQARNGASPYVWLYNAAIEVERGDHRHD